ncbi:hypothetical protein V8U11_06130 [Pseudomonas chlororaphis]|uniref:hypothetical protein n=1 Tax=Pseudomonas chlororaphis TaxID=587753 RepID=UPI0030D25D06
MLEDKLIARRTRLPWRFFLLVAGLLLAFVPMIFDLLRVQQLEQAARQLDSENVAVYSQRRTDRASLEMLGASLNAIKDRPAAGSNPIAGHFQLLRAVVGNHRNASLVQMEYSQDQWRLDLQVGSLRDITELQRGWQALGFCSEIDHVEKSEQALLLQVKLKQVRY